jgi:T-complex protein 1 subunit alpha
LLQILVELAELQDAEVGDGTTSVVILAAELLKRANELVRNKIHPTNIISGYRLAMKEVGLAFISKFACARLTVLRNMSCSMVISSSCIAEAERVLFQTSRGTCCVQLPSNWQCLNVLDNACIISASHSPVL